MYKITDNAKKIKIIIEELQPGIGVIPIIYRTRAGRHQKSAGAFLWFMDLEPCGMVGSIHRVAEILKDKDRLYIHQCDRYTDSIELCLDI